MTPDGALVPHQTLHRSPRRIDRYYFQCACGFLRGPAERILKATVRKLTKAVL